MRSKKQLLKNWKVYAILDEGLFADRSRVLRKFRELLESPVDVLQFRFKDLTDSFFYDAAEEMAALARKKEIPFIINDRPDVALSVRAAGVHLGKSDVPASVAREMLGPGAIIGRTIRKAEDLEFIDKKNVDYVSVGPVFRTPLKPGLKTVSRSELRELCSRVRMPLVGIGGINVSNVRKVAAQGIKTVAFARFGVTEKDTRKKIEELRKAM